MCPLHCVIQLCHSLRCETTFILKGIQKHPTVDEPITSWTVCVVQDILVPHLFPRSAQSSCACERWACLCVTEGTSLTELHYAGAASDFCAFTGIMCFRITLLLVAYEQFIENVAL